MTSDGNAPGAGGEGKLVAVTGASGYLGSHLVELLLGEGYRVRGVVRDPGRAEKVAHLRRLAEGAAHPLELVAGDLLAPGSFDEAFRGCEAVFHLASSVRLRAKDPQAEIVDVAVKGTRNVLESARKAGSVETVVLTSSVAAVTGHDRPEGHVFTEKDWNQTSTLKDEPYPLAKTLAERAAWEYHEGLPEPERFRLVALCPVVVLGPLLAKAHYRSSPNLVGDIFFGGLPACPRIFLSMVDVRDVALAHLRALGRPEAKGRYILQAGGLWMQEIGRVLAPRFPGHPVRTRRLPDLALYAASLFDKRLSFGWVRRTVGKVTRLDDSRARSELGVTYRPLEDTLTETCQSFVELGLGPRKR
ncbi:MAG: NAD-dependent epimerase/dehydratase family protein [Polyangia bacterium]|jgi:nucleoside-diphosphate-sugar epimerase|nr:NAD-dependent epimerase/dehydratase family protein [Polyangia bacterium]